MEDAYFSALRGEVLAHAALSRRARTRAGRRPRAGSALTATPPRWWSPPPTAAPVRGPGRRDQPAPAPTWWRGCSPRAGQALDVFYVQDVNGQPYGATTPVAFTRLIESLERRRAASGPAGDAADPPTSGARGFFDHARQSCRQRGLGDFDRRRSVRADRPGPAGGARPHHRRRRPLDPLGAHPTVTASAPSTPSTWTGPDGRKLAAPQGQCAEGRPAGRAQRPRPGRRPRAPPCNAARPASRVDRRDYTVISAARQAWPPHTATNVGIYTVWRPAPLDSSARSLGGQLEIRVRVCWPPP